MKPLKHILWFFITFVSLGLYFSCSSPIILDEFHEFPNQKWMRFEPDTFVVHIVNAEDCYDFHLKTRYSVDVNFMEDKVPVIVKIYGPNGGVRSFIYSINVKSKVGTTLGEKVGNVYDNTGKMKEHFFFNNTGEYKIVVQQVTSQFEISNMLGVGLKVEKSNLNYDLE